MSRWTHAVCENEFESVTGRDLDMAVRVRNPETEKCCFCGNETNAGLYVRYDPAKLKCNHK